MYTLAHVLELFTLVCALLGVTLACLSLYENKPSKYLALVEKASIGLTSGHILASLILLYALITYDFSVDYVAGYTDLTLPLFYRLTAFWAGQAGSLLFWALMVAICGACFQLTESYRSFSDETKQWYWVFYLFIMAFFGYLLSTSQNPFTTTFPAPPDGRGMNPLLQNPGMIIHPPLLFLGYGGFTIPSCLALAQALSKSVSQERRWSEVSRPFIMTAWIFLSAGILLGAWWAYMELGWGGYWAWDPVENASLLPWLIASAALHTMIIEQRRNKLHRTNIFLMALTTITAFFATYLVRGNVVDSVHAFGSGGAAMPLLLFVVLSTLVALFISIIAKKQGEESLCGVETREGFLFFTAWILIAMTVIILLATLWPRISLLWSEQAVGLDAKFYNQVCLPLFTVICAMLAICPYLGWNGGLVDKKNLYTVIGVIVINFVSNAFFAYENILALFASSVSIGVIASSILQLSKKSTRAFAPKLAAHGVHLGLALIILGVTYSSAYKIERDLDLKKGESAQLGAYVITLNEIYEGRAATFDFLEAELYVSKNGKIIGELHPQKRIYNKFGNQSFSEVGTMPSLKDEIYASLFGLEDGNTAVLRVSSNPLVNWIWIGSFILCLFPFFALETVKRRNEDDEENVQAE